MTTPRVTAIPHDGCSPHAPTVTARYQVQLTPWGFRVTDTQADHATWLPGEGSRELRVFDNDSGFHVFAARFKADATAAKLNS